MKKIVVFMLFMLLPNVSFGADNNLSVDQALSVYESELDSLIEESENKEFVEMAKQMLPVYESMKTCSPNKNQ